MNMYRAVLISGSPGIGKTTSAHLVAKMAGYNPIELNASDARSKKLVEVGFIDTAIPRSGIELIWTEWYQHRQYESRRLLFG
jgi:DNA polymerase III delta prime subunit